MRTTETNETTVASPCADTLCEIAGRDRVVGVRLREEAARLIRLAEALETNASIATHSAAALMDG